MSSPGTPAIQNIIPMRFLETSSMAAPITGAIGGIAEFVMIFLWLEYRARKMSANGEEFVAQAGYDMQAHNSDLAKIAKSMDSHDSSCCYFGIVQYSQNTC